MNFSQDLFGILLKFFKDFFLKNSPRIFFQKLEGNFQRTITGFSEGILEETCEASAKAIPEGASRENLLKFSMEEWLIGLLTKLLIKLLEGFPKEVLNEFLNKVLEQFSIDLVGEFQRDHLTKYPMERLLEFLKVLLEALLTKVLISKEFQKEFAIKL